MVLFDLGAHFGLFSLAALHFGGLDSRVVAVDPSPEACRMIRLQANLNAVHERLAVVPACVGEHTGWTEMVDSGVQSAGYFVPPTPDHPRNERTRIRCTTIDSLADELRLSPTHIKIDVEGGEAEVLRGGAITLAKTQAPLLFLELHNRIVTERGGNAQQSLTILSELGYETFTSAGTPLDSSTILARPLIRVIARKRALRSAVRVA
jgi:FkbM family methyltransferase